MRASIILCLFALSLFLAACSKDQIYRSLYEGTTTHERLKNPPGPNNDPMSYNQYEVKRKEKDKLPATPAQPVIPTDPGGPPWKPAPSSPSPSPSSSSSPSDRLLKIIDSNRRPDRYTSWAIWKPMFIGNLQMKRTLFNVSTSYSFALFNTDAGT